MRDKVSKLDIYFCFWKGTGPPVTVSKNRASPFFPFSKRGRHVAEYEVLGVCVLVNVVVRNWRLG